MRGEVKVFTDSDFANDTDDRKSVSGGFVYWGSNLINWVSKKQRIVSVSTMEAEMLAVFDTMEGCKQLLRLLKKCIRVDSLMLFFGLITSTSR